MFPPTLRNDELIAKHQIAPARVNDSIHDLPPLTETLSVIPPELTETVDRLLLELNRSVNLRVRDIPYHE